MIKIYFLKRNYISDMYDGCNFDGNLCHTDIVAMKEPNPKSKASYRIAS